MERRVSSEYQHRALGPHLALMVHRYNATNLTYSAAARCRCGSGLAYGQEAPIWRCSALLAQEGLVVAPRKGHDHPKRIATAGIMDENHEHAGGQSTMPV